jgi:hypothetical protein
MSAVADQWPIVLRRAYAWLLNSRTEMPMLGGGAIIFGTPIGKRDALALACAKSQRGDPLGHIRPDD